MKLLLYFLFILLPEIFAYAMALSLDYYGKLRNYNTVVRSKLNYLMFQSDYEKNYFLPNKGRPISKKGFVYQIFNYCFMLVYISMSIIETIVYSNNGIMLGLIVVVIAYGLINFIVSMYLGGLIGERIKK